jgi:hypothetical protein
VNAAGRPAEHATLTAFAAAHVGPCRVVRDRSWLHGDATVLELTSTAGVPLIVKAPRASVHYHQEQSAYLHWVPALGDRAPELLASDERLHALLLSYVGDQAADGRSEATHKAAGKLIRSFHDAAAPVPAPDYGAGTRERLDEWLSRGRHLFAIADIDFVRGRIADLESLRSLTLVPAHLDNQPRNWIVRRDGALALIDYSLSRRDIWLRDLIRLQTGNWQGRPDLRDAFLNGYGRQLSDTDTAVLDRCVAMTGLTSVIWGAEHDDDTMIAFGREVLVEARRSVHRD